MLEKYRSRVTLTTSLRQGQTREGMSGGSQRQTCEPTDRNVIEGRDSWGKSATQDKAYWFREHGKWRGCAGTVHGLIRGDLPKMRSVGPRESD
jgi:hypothetical protein